MRIPAQFVQELKHSLNLVEVAGDYMRLVRKGRNYFALCPFHTEKTPSFSINEQLQSYHCFGCSKSGDVIRLVMELDNLGYVDAILFLAERANLKVPYGGDADEKASQDRKFIYTVTEEAARFFERSLQSDDGAPAREYLEKRGITLETILRHRLGFAPGDGFHLLSYLRSLGVRDAVIQQAGLAKVSETSGRHYDGFRNRLIIPILDQHGRVIAFGGRIMGEGEPKYLNSPETPIYQKSFNLFGLHHAVREIRSQDLAVLVEGYFDVIAPHQAGVANVVASLGTSLTAAQVRLLGRFTRRVVVCFDPDAAGANAALRSVELFLEHEFDCRVAVLPDGHDPDTFVLTKGADAFRAVLAESKPFLDYLLYQKMRSEKGELTVERKSRIMESLFPFLARIPQEVVRSSYLLNMARVLQVHQEALFAQFDRFRKSRKVEAAKVAPYSTPVLLPAETELLNYLFHFPEAAAKIFKEAAVTRADFESSKILGLLFDLLGEGRTFSPEELEARLGEDERILLHQVVSRDRQLVSENDAVSCLRTLRRKTLERRLEQLNAQIKTAEAANDATMSRQVLADRKKLLSELQQL